jgi:hypothetical protein
VPSRKRFSGTLLIRHSNHLRRDERCKNGTQTSLTAEPLGGSREIPALQEAAAAALTLTASSVRIMMTLRTTLTLDRDVADNIEEKCTALGRAERPQSMRPFAGGCE